ncbi:hypothetical protein FDECE_8510 [Fusarium decemcellulare]|nr:hypothetical protein FDECE_8510 [Fusarium decemcellulare]
MTTFSSWEEFELHPKPQISVLDPNATCPWIVQGHIHTVEVYQAILSKCLGRTTPLKLWVTEAGFAPWYEPKSNGQWRLIDRRHSDLWDGSNVTFVLVTPQESLAIRTWLQDREYIYWEAGHLLTPFGNPKMMLFEPEEPPEKYLGLVQETLRELGLQGKCFPRSFLLPGMKPLPFTVSAVLDGENGPAWSPCESIYHKYQCCSIPGEWVDWVSPVKEEPDSENCYNCWLDECERLDECACLDGCTCGDKSTDQEYCDHCWLEECARLDQLSRPCTPSLEA